MSRTNETKHIKFHETYKCTCRLDPGVCNNRHRRNNDKCRWECKELVEKGVCDKGFIWIQVNFRVNMINYVMLENILIMKTVIVGNN